MRNGLMNMNWVRSFEAAARHLSFTGAAQELHMTQAGVSQQIRSLEFHLGEALFHRLPRGLRLTDAGEAYLHVVRDAFGRLSAGTSEIFGQAGGGPVSVRSNVAFATLWLAKRLKAFHGTHPGIGLRLISAVHGNDTIWEGVDLEIRYGGEHVPGLMAVPLTADRLFPVCAPELLEGPRGLRRPEDLLHHRLLHVIGNPYGWDAWFKAAGLQATVPGEGLQTDTSAIALALAAAGLGVALGHSSLVGTYLAGGRLVMPFNVAVSTKNIFYLVMPENRPLRRDAAIFRDWLLQAAAETLH